MANITSIAQELNISPSTVSRALKRPDMVSPKTRDSVMKEALSQGYIADDGKRRLRANNRFIGVLVADLDNSFSSCIVKAVQNSCYGNGFIPVVGCHYENPDLERHALKTWRELELSGIVAMPTANFAENFMLTQRKDLPCSLVDRDIPQLSCHKVLENNQQGMLMALEHLKEFGHSRICVLTGNTSVFTFSSRKKAALTSEPKPEIIELEAVSYEDLYVGAFEQTNILLMRPERLRPTAIIAANNAIAIGVMYALSLRHISIPEQISVISYGDSEWARFYPVPITCIRQPTEEMGRKATELLLQSISSRLANKTVILEPMLMPRASTSEVSLKD